MKRFAITTCAVLYALLVFSVSAERSVWAVREAEAAAHSSSGLHSHGFGKTEKTETLLSKKKKVEAEFVVELPREAAAGPAQSEPYILLSPVEYHTTQNDRPFSSRAPPSNA